jgi:hypothetical protein
VPSSGRSRQPLSRECIVSCELSGPSAVSEDVRGVARALRAESVRFERPAARGGVVAPLLWVLELGSFEAWPGAQTWDLCFGKASRCLIDPDDPTTTVCAELIVARRLIAAGFDAGWLNTYGSRAPLHWTPQMQAAVACARTLQGHAAVATIVGAGGTPDVFGSRAGEIVFVEVKRHPDRLKAEQVTWFETALASGFPTSGLFVANWTGTT